MQQVHNIRSYQPFPAVIPVHSASSLRVTHPSAMVSRCKHRFPIDLHVLSILSAFILSQDQTLHSIYFSHIFSFHLFFVLWQRFLFSLKTSLHLCFFFLFCFPLSSPTFAVDKNYITKFITFCQYLFLSFFPFFIPPLLLYPSITPYTHYISFPLLFLNTICCFVPWFLFFDFFCFFLSFFDFVSKIYFGSKKFNYIFLDYIFLTIFFITNSIFWDYSITSKSRDSNFSSSVSPFPIIQIFPLLSILKNLYTFSPSCFSFFILITLFLR